MWAWRGLRVSSEKLADIQDSRWTPETKTLSRICFRDAYHGKQKARSHGKIGQECERAPANGKPQILKGVSAGVGTLSSPSGKKMEASGKYGRISHHSITGDHSK